MLDVLDAFVWNNCVWWLFQSCEYSAIEMDASKSIRLGGVNPVDMTTPDYSFADLLHDQGHSFFAAVSQGCVPVVEGLLKRGVSVNATDKYGQTGLFVSAANGNIELVKLLLRYGANVDAVAPNGFPVLFHAVFQDSVGVVEFLLNHGANVNATDGAGRTVLFFAAERGNSDVVQALLRHGGDVSVPDKYGRTALFLASANGNCQVAEVLLSSGAKVEVCDKYGNPLMFYTAHMMTGDKAHGSLIRMLRLLISRGADVNRTNSDGENLLLFFLTFARNGLAKMDESSLGSFFEVLDFLITECKSNLNVIAPSSGHSVIHLVLLLLRDIFGQTFRSHDLMLKQCIAEKCLKLLSYILSHCSKMLIRSRDHHANTPLHIWASFKLQHRHNGAVCDTSSIHETGSALYFSYETIGACLLFHRADVHAVNNDRETPLHMAASWKAVELLLEEGALPNITDLHGNTPLLGHVTKMIGHHLTCAPHLPLDEIYNCMGTTTLQAQWEEIFQCGMDPWRTNDKGCTVLGTLLQADAYHLIQSYLEATKVHLNVECQVDNTGDTPLHIICKDVGETHFWKLNLLAELIRPNVGIVNCQNRQGQTPLHILCQNEVESQLVVELGKQLCTYAAKIEIEDRQGKTCLDLAIGKPKLRAVLTQVMKGTNIKPWVPWSSKSHGHKNLLAEVAQTQTSRQIDSVHYHKNVPIGEGCFGFVYAGIDFSDGREVAVKRHEKERLKVVEAEREIKSLVRLSDCEHVVRYLGLHQDQNFFYVVLELMEGTLTELIDNQPQYKEKEVALCRDVAEGLMFLHQKGFCHRDIRPSNILYNCSPKLTLKLADFGLSRQNLLESNKEIAWNRKAGTHCWLAPELLGGTSKQSKGTDVFAFGLVLHYLLSEKKHPFEPESGPGKSSRVIEHETVGNIRANRKRVAVGLSHEARDLVEKLLDVDQEKRPSAPEAVKHPIFWSTGTKFKFLIEVANQPEVGHQQDKVHHKTNLSSVEQEIEECLANLWSTVHWTDEVDQIFTEMNLCPSKQPWTYRGDSAVDLLFFVRNAHSHLPLFSIRTKTPMLNEGLFFQKFPGLFIGVYNAVRSGKWDQREEIASILNSV